MAQQLRRSVMMALLSCATHATAFQPRRNCFARLQLALLPGTLKNDGIGLAESMGYFV